MMMMMMMIIFLLPQLERVAADGKTFCFFAGRLSSLLRLPLAARLFFCLIFAHLLTILSSRSGEGTESGVGRKYGC